MPIGEHPDKLRCGIGVVELATGRTIATLQFHSGVDEIFAVEVIPGARNPKIGGPTLKEETDQEIWIVPSDSIPPFPTPASSDLSSSTPHDADVIAQEHLHRGIAAHQQGNLTEAMRHLQLASKSNPKSPEMLNQLGNLFQDLKDPASAEECYKRAIAIQPELAATQQNLGVLFSNNNHPHRALHHFELAQQSSPSVMNLLLGAKVLPIIYESIEQLNYWRDRVTQRVKTLAESNIVLDTTNALVPTSFYCAYQGANNREIMQDLAKVCIGTECCESAKTSGHRPKNKRIRVGFVSAYFNNHTVGRLNLGRIQNLPRDQFEVNVIALSPSTDRNAEAYKRTADNYINVPRQPANARKIIADLGLDVLFFADVGMDCLSQTLCYSRMAPIQAVTWGHPDTTGSPMIDYFVSSQLAEPDDAESHYSEELVKLSNLGICYERPQLEGPARKREQFGLDPNRRVYICPQTLFKFHPDFDYVLRGILEADPEGDLVLIAAKSANWNEALRQRWRRTLPGLEQRIKFLPSVPRADFLHLLTTADVMLDPFPFCGGNTTYEALGVGTPVITYPGRFLRGRLTLAMYQQMGLTTPIASSPDEYVQLAVSVATDPSFGSELRRSIVETRDVLFDFSSNSLVFEEMLHRWCER